MDILTHKFSILAAADGLPHDCFSLVACSNDMSGVVVISGNAIIYVDQSGRKLGLPVNGWASRVSDMPFILASI
jgi:cleavage and polyadenylation specificity factor subunit 1